MTQTERIVFDLSKEQLEKDIQNLNEITILEDEIYAKLFFPNPSEIDKQSLKNSLFARATQLKLEKKLNSVQAVKDKYRATDMLDKIARKEKEIVEKERLAELARLARPSWVDEKGKINEVAFCHSFGEYDEFTGYKYKCVGGKMYSKSGAVSDSELLQAIQNQISQCLTVGIHRSAESLLRALKNCCYTEAPKPNCDFIHLNNGCYDIANRQFTSRMDFTFNRLNADFESDYNPPQMWLKFLDELLNQGDILTLQEYMGYCLIPSKKAQKALYMHGKGGEGKSVIKEVLADIFGASMVSMSLHEIVESKFSLATLDGKLLAVDDDAELSALKETGKLKTLVTDMDSIQVNPKGLPAYETVIFTRLISLSNEPIKALYDQTEGNFRRQIIISTKAKRKGRTNDPFLGDKLKKEKSNILRWCIQGLHRLIDNDYHFTISDQAKSNLEDLKKDSFNILSYVESEDFIRFTGNMEDKISTGELYRNYKWWCDINEERARQPRSLSNFLKSNQDEYNIEATGNVLIQGKRCRGFRGIKVHSNA